ncbi:hypothetical protein [Terasakiella sp.]|uniref:hypothetical protein n=1 Tax=Terasakiella sp. TaxID=2034861 RepID=UPI003AA91F87
MSVKKTPVKQFSAQQIVVYANANCSAQVAKNTAAYQANKPSKQADKSVFLKHANTKAAHASVNAKQSFKAAFKSKMQMLVKLAAQYAKFGNKSTNTAKASKINAIANMLFNYAKRLKLPEYMSDAELHVY